VSSPRRALTPAKTRAMGCCFGKDTTEIPPAFDPVIGLSEKLRATGIEVSGSVISGCGSILGDSPVLQDKAYFEATLQKGGSFALGIATRDAPLEGILSQDNVSACKTGRQMVAANCNPMPRPNPRT